MMAARAQESFAPIHFSSRELPMEPSQFTASQGCIKTIYVRRYVLIKHASPNLPCLKAWESWYILFQCPPWMPNQCARVPNKARIGNGDANLGGQVIKSQEQSKQSKQPGEAVLVI